MVSSWWCLKTLLRRSVHSLADNYFAVAGVHAPFQLQTAYPLRDKFALRAGQAGTRGALGRTGQLQAPAEISPFSCYRGGS